MWRSGGHFSSNPKPCRVRWTQACDWLQGLCSWSHPNLCSIYPAQGLPFLSPVGIKASDIMARDSFFFLFLILRVCLGYGIHYGQLTELWLVIHACILPCPFETPSSFCGPLCVGHSVHLSIWKAWSDWMPDSERSVFSVPTGTG